MQLACTIILFSSCTEQDTAVDSWKRENWKKNLVTNVHVQLQSRVRSTEKGRTAGKWETDMTERILQIVAAHPTVKNVMLHTGPADLLNTISLLNAIAWISGPLPPVRGGAEGFSGLFCPESMALNCMHGPLNALQLFQPLLALQTSL